MKNLIITKIKEWAEKAPNTYFFDEGDSSLTYGELERYSDALASHLESNFSKKLFNSKIFLNLILFILPTLK